MGIVQNVVQSTTQFFPQTLPDYLFNRAWSVTVTPLQDTGTKDQYGTEIYLPAATGFQYTGLKVTFDINKTSEGESNKGKVEIWNLSPDTRKQFQKGAQLTLQAGYVGLLQTIYIGDILSSGVKFNRNGADVVTSFECGSWERQIETAILNKSYAKGTPVAKIISDCAAAMQVGISVALLPPNLLSSVYNTSIAASRSVKDVMNLVCARFGLDWSVQNDELRIKPKGTNTGETAIVLCSGLGQNIPKTQGDTGSVNINSLNQSLITTQNTGLLGVPSRAEDGKTTFTALLNPLIVPGALVQLISENVNGFFQVRTAHFKGDSHGNDWSVDCEAYECPQVVTISNDAANLAG